MNCATLCEKSAGSNDTITLETTVVTGFEFLALEECKEKCKTTDLTRSKGRLFFNIPVDSFDKAKSLRSVDNIYLVFAAFKELKLQSDKDKDLEIIKSLVDLVDWKRCVESWAGIIGFEGILFPETGVPDSDNGTAEAEEQSKILKFRVTCNRSGDHTFTSMEAARDFGGNLQDKFNWTVDLTKFDIEVVLNIISGTAYVCAALTKESLHRRNITHFGSTTLRATLCYNLVRLAEPGLGDIVIDPLCGGSSISIEGSLAFPDTYHLAGDCDDKAVNRSSCNLQYLKQKDRDLKVELFQWDTRRLPLKDESVDVFVTDLPFGKRSGKKQDNKVLYKRILNELARVVRPKSGRASILTGDKTAFIQALGHNHPYWKQARAFTVNQGGVSAIVYLLIRSGKSFLRT